MYFPDLEAYCYDVPAPLHDVVTVGWLSKDHEYARGDASAETLEAIEALIGSHQAHPMRGYHVCEFCGADPRTMPVRPGLALIGSAEIWVPSSDLKRIYAAPNLIHHYMSAHRYLPPQEFLDAVAAVHEHTKWDADRECEERLDAAWRANR
jgi:hypothetical protein